MAQVDPARVFWLFAKEDRSIAHELLDLAAVLELQGLITNSSRDDLPLGKPVVVALEERVQGADVVMLLYSPALQKSGELSLLPRLTSDLRRRVVPVRLRNDAMPLELQAIVGLPRFGEPLLVRSDRREGLLDVIRGLQEVVAFRHAAEPVATPAPTGTSDSSRPRLDEIFRLDGPPSLTFVEPPQFSHLKFELRTMGTGLIVEGPSKVGKSTAIKKAMESLGIGEHDQIWWHGQQPPTFEEFQRKLDDLRQAARDTWLFIDDFHYLEDERYRRALAICMKLLADQTVRHAKVTLIGINPLGSSLTQVMPDLSGRFRIQRLDVEKDWKGSNKIAELIVLGERAANIRFLRRDEFIVTAGGSFFLAQWLCNRAALEAGVLVAQPTTVEIALGPADVLASIRDELGARFRAPLLQFVAFDVVPPPRGAGLSLLWLLARSSDGFVPLREARLRFPMLSEVFDWFLESNLTRCFHEHPQLRGLLYYNRATTTLTAEDPQLRFYLRELDWEEFALASGHRPVKFHPNDGPIWPTVHERSVHLNVNITSSVALTLTRPTRLLHLSDLHLDSKEHATLAYSQLAADLRQQATEKLDALVVSGDLVNRAEPREYEAAALFLEKIMAGFGLSARQVALVPGNHDVNWSMSKSAYGFKRREDVRGPLTPGSFIEHGSDVIELRDEDAYQLRFQPFAHLYKQIKGEDYPLEYARQGTLDAPDSDVLILGLNSAWDIDHHYRDRASIRADALAIALDKLGPPTPTQLRIAVFHHPLVSDEDSRIKDPSFLQRLSVAGFRLLLHGHVHKEGTAQYRYDQTVDGRKLDIVAAGTFGAATREWVPGYPLEYNLLLVGEKEITVETRCRREVNGAWEPYARWLQGEGKDPLPRYTIPR